MTDAAEGAIRFERWPTAALAYHVLAHLDLGRDAASLFDDTLPPRPWVAGLRAAYLAAPGRLAVHAAPLSCGDRLVERLRNAAPASLRDGPGRALAQAFANAIDREAPEFLASWDRQDPRSLVDVANAIGEPLARLRRALWERTAEPPPLVVVHCPALGRHARATRRDDARIVAADCTQSIEWLACQVLHEEIHAITDPAVLAGRDASARDTRVGTPGFVLHAELERAAIEVGDALVRARAPEWADAYARWRAAFEPRG
jgi:hypothetical protein